MKQGDRRKFLPRILIVQMVAVAALFVGVLSSAASSGTNIAAGSATMVAGSQGSSTTVVTRAAADSNFNAFDITLAFDPSVVSVANVTAASGWSLMPAPRIHNDTGTVQVIAVRFDVCATSCPVFSVTWNGLAAGSTALTLVGSANESLAGAGEYVTSGFTAGSVTVSAPATATPTSSASPTSTPSASATPSPTASPTATPQVPATPAPGAPASLLAGSGGAASGSTFTTTTAASLGVSTAKPGSFAITLTFDPGIATVEKVTAWDGWSFAPQPSFDNVAGTVHVSGLRFSDCSSYCPLFIIEWKAVAAGSGMLQLQGNANQVLGANGANQPASFTAGAITVTPLVGPAAPAAAKPTTSAQDVPVLPHTAGWNLLTWGGDAMTPQQALSASNPNSIEVIYVWDSSVGKWRRYGPSLPGYLNDLTTVKPGDVIWLSSTH